MIYHYTSFDALIAILNAYKKSENKENVILRASNIYSMNDPSEMTYGYNSLMAFINRYENNLKIPPKIQLSTYVESTKQKDLFKETNEDFWYQHFYNESKTPYVISFSKVADELPMWGLYGNNGKGVCICFDEGLNLNKSNVLLDVMYTNSNSNYPKIIFEKLIQEEINKYYEDCNKAKTEEELIDSKLITLGSILPLYSSFIKDKTYMFEKEKRLVILPFDSYENIHTASTPQGNIRSYVNVPLPISCIKHILIGPCANHTFVQKQLNLLLHCCGLEIESGKSNIPYRII